MPRKGAGYSLIETVVALFLLALAVLLVTHLFHASLQRSRLSESERVARVLAERKLAEIRAWAAGGGFVSTADLATYDGTVEDDPDHAGFQVAVRAEPVNLTSPCSQLALALAPAERRVLDTSCGRVAVTVNWSGSNGAGTMSLLSMVAEAERTLDSVVVQGSIPDPVPGGTSFSLQAVAYDDQGREIKDLSFIWWVEAGTKLASIQATGDTSTATVTNPTQLPDGTPNPNGGTCRVAVMAKYFGQEVTGYSGTINLSP